MTDPHVAVIATAHRNGGAEQHAVGLYRHLAEHGMVVELFGSLPGWESARLPRHDVGWGPKWSRRSVVGSVRRAAKERRTAIAAVTSAHSTKPFTAIHMQYKREQILLTGALAAVAPVVWTEHGVLPRGGILAGAQRIAYRHASRKVSQIAAVSPLVAESIREAGVKDHLISTIPNGVDLGRFHPTSAEERALARERLGFADPSRLVVAWVGRLDPAKRVRLALDAIARLPGALLVVAGDGDERSVVLERADGPDVAYLGQVDDIRDVYAAADVFLFTSDGRGEGFPIVLIEAASTGLPIVTVEDCAVRRLLRDAAHRVASPTAGSVARAIVGAHRELPAPAVTNWAAGLSFNAMAKRYAQLLAPAREAPEHDGAGVRRSRLH